MRKSKPKKRVRLSDQKFSDTLVTRFVNKLMLDGKKCISDSIFYSALHQSKDKAEKEGKSVLEIWQKALENVTPNVEVKSRRVGGATCQVPTEIRAERRVAYSMKNVTLFEIGRAQV